MPKKPKVDKGVIRSGYGFMFHKNKDQTLIQITNMTTFNTMYVVAPESVITVYDLRIFADGFAAGHHPAWAKVI
jgi:hypothetical protein